MKTTGDQTLRWRVAGVSRTEGQVLPELSGQSLPSCLPHSAQPQAPRLADTCWTPTAGEGVGCTHSPWRTIGYSELTEAERVGKLAFALVQDPLIAVMPRELRRDVASPASV